MSIRVYSKTPHPNWKVLTKQNARGAREIAFAAILSLNVSLKRKTDNISIIARRMNTAERARAVNGCCTTAIRTAYAACLHRPIVEYRRPKWLAT